MRSGFKIARIFGINVYVDWSWLLIFLLVTWNLAGAVFPSLHPGWPWDLSIASGIAAPLLFFFSILLHELAHSVVARERGQSALPEFRDPSIHYMPYERQELGPWQEGRTIMDARMQRSRTYPGPHVGKGPRNYTRSDERIYEEVCDRRPGTAAWTPATSGSACRTARSP